MPLSPLPGDRASRLGLALKLFALVTFVLFAATAGVAVSVLAQFNGKSVAQTIVELPRTAQAIRDPRSYFPGRDRITILCLGLDRNIFRSRDPRLNGMPYTKGARSDVMMVASLDLTEGSVAVLSIPRDTRVRLPGRRSYSKINEAHADGGIPYTRQTVEEFLGAPIDYHVVIKQEAVEALVDRLGGLRLDVEKDMDYDDNWGQLHVHLKAGEQVLNGEQVAGYMRFRHDAEGDFGRIRRQQQVIRALAEQAKNPSVLFKIPGLIQEIRRYVQTDLTPEQQIALAHLFHRIDPANVLTYALPAAATATIDGVSYVIIDEFKKEAAVDWILRGNLEAMNRLIRVEVKNASGDPALADRVYECLRHFGFDVSRGGRAPEAGPTRVVQHTGLRGAGRRVLDVLGLAAAVERAPDGGPDVTLYVGADLKENPVVLASESWPEPPVRYATRLARGNRAPRRRRPSGLVRVRPVPPAEEPVAPAGEEAGESTPAPDTPDAPAAEPMPAPDGSAPKPGAEGAASLPGPYDMSSGHSTPS